jgi:hypothetical protein
MLQRVLLSMLRFTNYLFPVTSVVTVKMADELELLPASNLFVLQVTISKIYLAS